jgi:hypothetical protein
MTEGMGIPRAFQRQISAKPRLSPANSPVLETGLTIPRSVGEAKAIAPNRIFDEPGSDVLKRTGVHFTILLPSLTGGKGSSDPLSVTARNSLKGQPIIRYL